MTFTPEQLRRFAEAGGWTFNEKASNYQWTFDNYQYKRLPDFPNDLAACFDVLECFCGKDYDYIVSRNYCDIVSGFDSHSIADGHGSDPRQAIIAAVLAAKEKP